MYTVYIHKHTHCNVMELHKCLIAHTYTLGFPPHFSIVYYPLHKPENSWKTLSHLVPLGYHHPVSLGHILALSAE